MKILTFPILKVFNNRLTHGFTSRVNEHTPPYSEEIRKILGKTLQIEETEFAIPVQVHSSNIRFVTRGGIYPETDALITNGKRVFLTINVADCVPVFLFDPYDNYCALIHAGWRGSASGITRKTVEQFLLRSKGVPENILAVIGPSIGKCCYLVGNEVADRFSPEVRSRQNDKWLLDLKTENKNQLLDSGIPGKNIHVNKSCTACESEKFYSYRREGKAAGRMIAIIGLI